MLWLIISSNTIVQTEHALLNERRKNAQLPPIEDNNINGLALSGGGIRSATFNLGVIQALEKHQQLNKVDILSSVSGGGYIASALTWFKSKRPTQFPFGCERSDHKKIGGSVLSWFRSHSSFLTPGNGINKMSLFTAIFTGSFINLLILLPITILAIFLAMIPFSVYLPISHISPTYNTFDLLRHISFVMFIISVSLMIITGFSTGINGLKNKKTEDLRKCVTTLFSWALLFQAIALIPILHSHFEQFKKWLVHASFSLSFIGALLTWLAAKKRSSSSNNSAFNKVIINVGLLLCCLGFFIIAYHYAQSWLTSPSHYLTDIFITLITLSIILAITCNINLISLHGYYRNRLRDAFMPFQLPQNNHSPVIDIATWQEAQACYLSDIPVSNAPFHILNCNIELTGSAHPKYRNRSGDCFTFNSLYSGSDATGYTATADYDGGKMDLASACAISGAAIATNTSKTKSKTLNFILALFNLRLGCWLPNPKYTYTRRFKLKPLWYFYMFRDMFGQGLNEEQKYIHLSDGGHFENLGVYELIRRQCKTIMSIDAGADPSFMFNDLAKLTEMIRVDFGAKLTIDTSPLLPDEHGISKTAYVIGEITYHNGKQASFIYVKSTMLNNLSTDVIGYKNQNPSFPDQSTIDQFFDEFQFEAYRELGFQITHRLLKQQPQLFS